MKTTLTLILVSFISFISFNSYANQELEKEYWTCDYISSTREMTMGDGATCGVIYETLLQEKFKGSFKDFMVWWKANKDIQHKIRKENESKKL